MITAARAALLDALALVLPVACAGCGLRDRSLCDACRLLLVPVVVERELEPGLPCLTALRYEAQPRQVVLAYKEEPRPGLARALAPAVDALLRAAPRDAEVLPVPTSRASYRRRGFDPVRTLVRTAGFRPVRVLAVRDSRMRQKALSIDARAANVEGTMRARRRLTGRSFVLIDDVLTTGATLREAIRAVDEAGGEVIFACALAFTRRIFMNPT